MEPRNDESQKPQDTPQEEKPRKRRFRIVKLEERIAPGGGGKGTNNSCGYYGCGGNGGHSRGHKYCGP